MRHLSDLTKHHTCSVHGHWRDSLCICRPSTTESKQAVAESRFAIRGEQRTCPIINPTPDLGRINATKLMRNAMQVTPGGSWRKCEVTWANSNST
jgi:hypothetical protein